MSQTWNVPPPAGTVAPTFWKTDVPNALESLRSMFSGASDPSSTVAYMLFADTSAGLWKMRNSGDSAFTTIGKLNTDLGYQSHLIRTGGISATIDLQLGVPKQTSWYVHRVRIISDTATSGSDGSNKYGFNIRNVTQAADLLAADVETDATEITADTPYDIDADQNQTVAVDDVLELEVTKTGAPTDLSSAEVAIQLEFTTSI